MRAITIMIASKGVFITASLPRSDTPPIRRNEWPLVNARALILIKRASRALARNARYLCIGRAYSAYSGARSFRSLASNEVRETANAKFVRSRSPGRMANIMDRYRGGDGHYANLECAYGEFERYLVLRREVREV